MSPGTLKFTGLEDGHAPHATCLEAMKYMMALTGGRADRCRDDYHQLAKRADELIERSKNVSTAN